MEAPELRVLAVVRWQLFLTLTFKREAIRDKVRGTMLMTFIRKFENVTQAVPRRLLWCCRRERGEIGSRLHFHLLIGGLPTKRVHKGLCFQTMRLWESMGGGFARVRVFDPVLDGLGYVLKGLDGADGYESGKFAGRSELTLSESCRRVVRRGSLRTDSPSSNGEKIE